MSRRRKALDSCLELMEDQYFHALGVVGTYERVLGMVKCQLVNGECLSLVRELGKQIELWVAYSEFSYRHPEWWPLYMDDREEERLTRLVRRDGKFRFVDQEIATLRRLGQRKSGDGSVES